MAKKKPQIDLASMSIGTKSVSRPVDTLKTKKDAEAKVPLQIYCTEELKKRLKMTSVTSDRSMTSLLTEALELVIEKHGS